MGFTSCSKCAESVAIQLFFGYKDKSVPAGFTLLVVTDFCEWCSSLFIKPKSQHCLEMFPWSCSQHDIMLQHRVYNETQSTVIFLPVYMRSLFICLHTLHAFELLGLQELGQAMGAHCLKHLALKLPNCKPLTV